MEEIPKNLSQKDLVKYLNVIMVLLKKIQGDSKSDLGAVEVKLNQLRDEVLSALEQVKLKKGEKGDPGESIKGDDGYTPIKGKDYFDGKDGKTPIAGIDFPLPKDGKDGINGYTPIAGVDYEIPENGKDGSPDTPEEVRDKLEELEDDERLPIKAIKDLREELDELKKASLNSQIVGGVAGGSNTQANNFTHQSTAISSATTTVDTLYGIAGSGYALWIYYQGQALARGVGYTVSLKTITLLFTPQDDTNLDIIYIRT